MVQHSRPIIDFVHSQLQTSGKGLEVAPYFDPFFDGSKFNVMFTDYISTEEIRTKAGLNPHGGGAFIQPVDFVWTPGARLRDVAPPGTIFDFALASHVIQQVPNPIGWLNQILELVKVGGKVALFIPDRRYTFEYFRNETKFGDFVHLWLSQPTVPTVAQILGFMTEGFRHDDKVTWDADGTPHNFGPAYQDEDAIRTATFVLTNKVYLDVMCTVWTATTAKGIFERLVKQGIMNVDVSDVIAENGEFLVILTKRGEPVLAPPAVPA